MNTNRRHLVWLALLLAGCSSAPPPAKEEAAKPADSGAYRVYVTNENSGDLTIIDSGTLAVIATVPVGKRPRGIRASADRKTIYVALSGSPPAPPGVDESKLPPPDKSADGIGVFDVAQNKFVRLIKSGSDPESFDLSKDGKLMYVSNEDEAMTTVVDLTTDKIVAQLKVGEEPEGVTTSPDGKFVYVTSEDTGSVNVIDTATQKVIKQVRVGRRPRSVAFTPDSARAYITCENDGIVAVMDAVKHTALAPIKLGEQDVVKPMGAAITADGSRLFISTGRYKQVFVIDTASNKQVSSFEVGQRPWGIALAPDGKTLYTANGPSNDISVVDAATGAVKMKVASGGRGPWGVITLDRP